MHILRQCLLLAFTCFAVVSAEAQGFDPSTAIDVPSSIGHGTDLEHVDLMSGAVVVRIPLLHLKGRGIDTDIIASYTSKLWSSRFYQDPYNGDYFFEDFAVGTGGSAWSVGVPGMIAGATGGAPTDGLPSPDFIYLDFLHRYDGSTIALASPIFNGTGGPTGPMFSYDSSYVLSPNANSLILKNGARLTFSIGGEQTLKDSNGNSITCAGGANCTDTLGRTITQTQSGSTSTITYLDSNGNSQHIVITYVSTPTEYPWIDGEPVCGNSVGINCVFNSGGGFGLISSIALPNGTSYQFQYADNGDGTTSGELTKLTLPTGGYVRYAYSTEAIPGQELTEASDRVVYQRFVSPDGTSTSEQPWTYHIPLATDPNGSTVSVTDPMGNVHSENFSFPIQGGDAINSPTFPGISATPISIQSKDTDAGANLLRQVDSTPSFDSSSPYSVAPNPNPRPVKTITTLYGSTQQAVKTLAYSTYGNISEEDEYDWGPSGGIGTLLRSTSYTYLVDTNTAYASDTVHVLDRRTSTSIQGNCGITFGTCATTSYVYDLYNQGRLHNGLVPTTAVVQHDYTSFSASNTLRGNVTQIIKGPGLNGGTTTTDIAYNDVGDVISLMDGRGNSTTYDFTDQYSGASQPSAPTMAFATTVTGPATNGIQHKTRSEYYLNSGLTAAACGENFPSGSPCSTGLTTPQADYVWLSYDSMSRTTGAFFGDGGSTTLMYGDQPSSTSVTQTRAMNATQNAVVVASYDGLGR